MMTEYWSISMANVAVYKLCKIKEELLILGKMKFSVITCYASPVGATGYTKTLFAIH